VTSPSPTKRGAVFGKSDDTGLAFGRLRAHNVLDRLKGATSLTMSLVSARR